MPASTKTELIDVTRREWGKLSDVIAGLTAEGAGRVFEDGLCARHIIGHRAHWIELFFNWYDAGQRGEHPAIPAEGYKWNQLPSYNAKLREAQKGLSWEDVCAMLEGQHARLMRFLDGQSDEALYGGPMPGGGNHWTTGRWAEAAGASHYRSATKYLRAQLRKA